MQDTQIHRHVISLQSALSELERVTGRVGLELERVEEESARLQDANGQDGGRGDPSRSDQRHRDDIRRLESEQRRLTSRYAALQHERRRLLIEIGEAVVASGRNITTDVFRWYADAWSAVADAAQDYLTAAERLLGEDDANRPVLTPEDARGLWDLANEAATRVAANLDLVMSTFDMMRPKEDAVAALWRQTKDGRPDSFAWQVGQCEREAVTEMWFLMINRDLVRVGRRHQLARHLRDRGRWIVGRLQDVRALHAQMLLDEWHQSH